jgi:hypothetical protein
MVPITWELLVAIFFIIIATYSFIIGRDETVKVIISTYIGLLAANGMGNLLSSSIQQSAQQIASINLTPDDNLVIIKISLFIFLTLLLILRGGFEINLGKTESLVLKFFSTGIYGILSAGLIISTVLVFITGDNLGGILSDISVDNPILIQGKTIYFNTFIKNHNIWFSLPALVLIINAIISRPDEE